MRPPHLAAGQAARLRERQWEAQDIDHLAGAVKSLGREQGHAVESHPANLLPRLLTMTFQRQRRLIGSRGIDNARGIERRLQRSRA
jgi:hypothetical protein